MKGAIFASALAAGLFSVVSVLLVFELKTPGPYRESPNQAEVVDLLPSLTTELQALREKVGSLEEQLAALRARETPPVPGETVSPAPAATPPAVASREDSSRDEASTGEDPIALTSQWEKEDSDGLREFVRQTIRQEREEHQEELRKQAEERRKEYAELRKGPYGNHNYKVNSIAKKLNLTNQQKEYYYELLTDYSDQIRASRKGIDWRNQESRTAFQEKNKQLTAQFNDAVIQGLTQEQREQYGELSEWEKRPAGGGGFRSYTTTSFGSGAEGKIQVNVSQ